jgi:hypothetical protein
MKSRAKRVTTGFAILGGNLFCVLAQAHKIGEKK